MKAILLERRGAYAALLREDGVFEKRRVRGAVGETIELDAAVPAFPGRKNRWMRTAVAAVLALTITGSTLGYMGGTASAYVSLDVEDSAIELTVNHFGRVIAVDALSDDAAELAETLRGEVRHHRVDDALEHTMKHLRDKGYLDDQDTAVIAGVASDNEQRSAELRKLVKQSAERGERPAYVSEMSCAERNRAMEQRISPGRFAYERDHGTAPAQKPDRKPDRKPPADGKTDTSTEKTSGE